MACREFTITSTLTPEIAFDRLVDLTRVGEWDRGITNAHQVRGDLNVVGSQYEVTVVGFDGQPTPVVYELLEVERPIRFVMEGATDVFCAHDVITVTATPAGSDITYSAGLELLEGEPPLTEPELDSLFVKVASVAERGLREYLNP